MGFWSGYRRWHTKICHKLNPAAQDTSIAGGANRVSRRRGVDIPIAYQRWHPVPNRQTGVRLCSDSFRWQLGMVDTSQCRPSFIKGLRVMTQLLLARRLFGRRYPNRRRQEISRTQKGDKLRALLLQTGIVSVDTRYPCESKKQCIGGSCEEKKVAPTPDLIPMLTRLN